MVLYGIAVLSRRDSKDALEVSSQMALIRKSGFCRSAGKIPSPQN
jgi:hypothetical protein